MNTDGTTNGQLDRGGSATTEEPGTKWKLVSTIRVGLLAALAIYWLSMFFGTHLTTMPQSLAKQSDKMLHCFAYFGLATLLLTWRISRGPAALGNILKIWLMIGLYGVFDELTQPLVGRHADIKDWLADLTGAALGVAITWPIASWLRSRLVAAAKASRS